MPPHHPFLQVSARRDAFVSPISVAGIAHIVRELREGAHSQASDTLSKRLDRAECLVLWQLTHLDSGVHPRWQSQLDRLYRLLLLRLAHLHLFEDYSVLGECETILVDLQTLWEMQKQANTAPPKLHTDLARLWAG